MKGQGREARAVRESLIKRCSSAGRAPNARRSSAVRDDSPETAHSDRHFDNAMPDRSGLLERCEVDLSPENAVVVCKLGFDERGRVDEPNL